MAFACLCLQGVRRVPGMCFAVVPGLTATNVLLDNIPPKQMQRGELILIVYLYECNFLNDDVYDLAGTVLVYVYW